VVNFFFLWGVCYTTVYDVRVNGMAVSDSVEKLLPEGIFGLIRRHFQSEEASTTHGHLSEIRIIIPKN
jgi:hypothetical protein